MNEFFVVATRRIAVPLSQADALTRLQRFTATWPVLEISAATSLEAVRGVVTYQFSFWDALIWASARIAQIPIVLSEDFSDGSVVEGVRFQNPFQAGFELNDWI